MPNYEDYLSYFFEKAETSVQKKKRQELTTNLVHLRELIQELVNRRTVKEDQFNSNYAFCERKYTQLYNSALTEEADESIRIAIVNSILSDANHAQKADDLDAFRHLLKALTNCYVSSYPEPGYDKVIKRFFENYSTLQYGIVRDFEKAKMTDQIIESIEEFEIFLTSYENIWQCSIENECEDSINELNNSLYDIQTLNWYQHSQGDFPSTDYDQDFFETKREVADKFRERSHIQKFAAYSWAYRLYVEDDYLSESFFRTLYEEYAEESFDSIESLSEVYFSIKTIPDSEQYWEMWETTRQFRNAVGPISVLAGTNTRVADFYLSFSLYLFDENTQYSYLNATPERLPIPTEKQHREELSRLHNRIQELGDNYPLKFLLNEHTNVNTRAERLSDVFEKAHTRAKRKEMAWLRNHPIDTGHLNMWKDRINERLQSASQLRQGMKILVCSERSLSLQIRMGLRLVR